MSRSDTITEDHWLRAEEAAVLLKVSVRTIYKLINDGDLPAVRVGNKWRIRRDAVLNFEVAS